MTNQPPPKFFAGTVRTAPLPAGTLLHRVHRSKFESDAFNSVGSEVMWGGGRFDSTKEAVYGYMYAAAGSRVAVAEALLRDIDPDDRGGRFLPRTAWRERTISVLRTTVDVQLLALRTGPELGAIGQDTWLTTCDSRDYAMTRAWAHWLREVAPDAAGIIWLSKRDPGEPVLALFDDRCPPGLLVRESGPTARGVTFDDPEGFDWLRETLGLYRVSVKRPRARAR